MSIKVKALLLGALCAPQADALPAPAAVAPKKGISVRSLVTSKGFLTLGVMAACVALGVHPAHAGTDTGVPDSYTLDTGAFNGVITGAGGYLNLLIKNFGVPAILVSLAISGWGFVRHIAKGAFH